MISTPSPFLAGCSSLVAATCWAACLVEAPELGSGGLEVVEVADVREVDVVDEEEVDVVDEEAFGRAPRRERIFVSVMHDNAK